MNKQMALSVLVRLVDRITGPLQRITGRVQGLTALTGRISAMSARVAGLAGRIGAIGALGAGLSFVGPLKAAADFDARLRDLAITSGTVSRAMQADVTTLARSYERLALEVGQRSTQLAEAAQILIAAGLDRDVVATLMPQLGRAATAAGAEIADMARMAVALNQNLRIAAERMENVFAGLGVGGKEGRFELPDMARAFPRLTGLLANLGVTGEEAVAHIGAALQIAMRAAAEPAQAATNVENFLSKILSKETIANFKKRGVDIRGTMEEAVWGGINPIEAAIKKILDLAGMTSAEIEELQARAKKGGITDPAEIAALSARIRAIRGGGEVAAMFGDMQVKNFLIPMLAGVADFRVIKDKIVTAMRGDPRTGVLADDFRSRMAGLTPQLERFAEVGEQATRRVGRAFVENLPLLNSALQSLLAGVNWLDTRLPGAVDKAIAWGGSLLLVATALGLLGPAIASGFGVLATAVVAVAGGIAALIGAPIWAVVAAVTALGAAAVVLYQKWEPIRGFLAGLWEGIEGAFSAAATRIARWWDSLIPEWVRRMFSGAGTPLVPMPMQMQMQAAGGKSYAPLAAPEQKVGGRIVVSVEGPGRVTRAESEHRDVPLVPDRGLMLGVP